MDQTVITGLHRPPIERAFLIKKPPCLMLNHFSCSISIKFTIHSLEMFKRKSWHQYEEPANNTQPNPRTRPFAQSNPTKEQPEHQCPTHIPREWKRPKNPSKKNQKRQCKPSIPIHPLSLAQIHFPTKHNPTNKQTPINHFNTNS